MSTAAMVAAALEDQMIIFGLLGLAVIGLTLYMGWLVRNWSWEPRKAQRTRFVERF